MLHDRARTVMRTMAFVGLVSVCFSSVTMAQSSATSSNNSHLGYELPPKISIVRSSIQALSDEIKNLSGPEYAWQTFKSYIPLYAEYKLRGNVAGVGLTDGLLLGSNLDQQTEQLWSEPLDHFQKDYYRIIERLRHSDLPLALQFALATEGRSYDEIAHENGWSLVELIAAALFLILLSRRFGRRMLDRIKATANGCSKGLDVSWRAKDTLIVFILGLVGSALGLSVGALRTPLPINMWLVYNASAALSWALIGLIVGAGLGFASRLLAR